jgi:hypothetical protein
MESKEKQVTVASATLELFCSSVKKMSKICASHFIPNVEQVESKFVPKYFCTNLTIQ